MLLRCMVLVSLAACIQSSSVVCPDGSLCPTGAVCAVIDETSMCVPPDDITACVGKDELAECGPELRCYQGVCLPTGCGNGRLEPGESCDDGNNGAGDGCSADCRSNERCGNGIVDLVGGEQCDDGPLDRPRSHDGCASNCSAETPRWTLVPDLFEAGGSWAYDADRQRMVLFVTLNNTAETWEFDGHRWMRQYPVISPVPRSSSALAYDVVSKRVIMFGGDAFNDTWAWDGVTWTLLTPTRSPPARDHHHMATDPVGQRIILFGGRSAVGMQEPLGDTWSWDGSNWTELPSSNGPSPREGAGLAFDLKRSVMVLFGGVAGAFDDNDETWELEGSTWVRKMPAATPGHRRRHIMAFDPRSQQIVIHAGEGGNIAPHTDTWLYDGTTWTMHPDPGPVMFNGSLAAMFAPERALITFDRGRTHRFDNGWSVIEAAIQQPAGGRSAAAGAVDVEGRRFVVHGGFDQGGASQSTLVWTGVWQRFSNTTTASPGRITDSAMAYDAKRKQFVLFGGTDGATAETVNETWIFDGTTWMQPTVTSPVPAARSGHVLAYDVARERVILFGGFGQAILDDTWEWDGERWSELTPPSKPPARYYATVSYDPIREVIVMFGGLTGGGFAGDTWEWNGVTWTDVTKPGPTARGNAGMAWDAARRRTVMFGGSTVGSPLNDQWEWDGISWTQLPALDTRRSRQHHLVFSALDGHGVMTYGGANQFGSINDELALLVWDSDAPEEICDGRDRDGDALDRCSDPDCWRVCTPLCPPGASASVACGPAAVGCGDTVCHPSSETCVTCPGDCGACL